MVSEELLLGAGVLAVAIAVTMTKKEKPKEVCKILIGYNKASVDALVQAQIQRAYDEVAVQRGDKKFSPPDTFLNDNELKRKLIIKVLQLMEEKYIADDAIFDVATDTDAIVSPSTYDLLVTHSLDAKKFTVTDQYVNNVKDTSGQKPYAKCQDGPIAGYDGNKPQLDSYSNALYNAAYDYISSNPG